MLKEEIKITYKKQTYYVYKINKSSIYIGIHPTSEVYEEYKHNKNFTKIMTLFNAKKTSAKEVLEANEIIEYLKFKNEKDDSLLSDCCKRFISNYAKNANRRLGTNFCPICSKKINYLKFENDNLLVSSNYKILHYNMKDKLFSLIKKVD